MRTRNKALRATFFDAEGWLPSAPHHVQHPKADEVRKLGPSTLALQLSPAAYRRHREKLMSSVLRIRYTLPASADEAEGDRDHDYE